METKYVLYNFTELLNFVFHYIPDNFILVKQSHSYIRNVLLHGIVMLYYVYNFRVSVCLRPFGVTRQGAPLRTSDNLIKFTLQHLHLII